MSNLIPHRRHSMLSSPFNMFDDFFIDNWFPMKNMSNGFKIDVAEENDKYVIEAEMPGINKDDVFLEFNDGRLTLGFEQNEETNDESKKYVHRERRYSSMQRSIYLGDAKSEGIMAKLDNGLLKIQVPKDDYKQVPSKIEIQ